MFSVTNTGMNLLPLWTAMFSPTNSGMITERRDQVRIRRRSSVSLARRAFFMRWSATKGPFFSDLGTFGSPCRRPRAAALSFCAPADAPFVGALVVARAEALGRLAPGGD